MIERERQTDRKNETNEEKHRKTRINQRERKKDRK
jgi:hypothetical protein